MLDKLIPGRPPDTLYYPHKDKVGVEGLERGTDSSVTLVPISSGVEVDAEAMYHAGFQFYPTEKGEWICRSVPRRYIKDKTI